MELSTRLSEQLSLLALGSARDGSGLIGDLTALVSTFSTLRSTRGRRRKRRQSAIFSATLISSSAPAAQNAKDAGAILAWA